MKMNCFAKKVSAILVSSALVFSAVSAQEIQGTPNGKGKPKYVFVFIGDGMSYPQIQATSYYLGKDAAGTVGNEHIKDTRTKGWQNAANPNDGPQAELLSFMKFPVVGSVQTYDATSFAPDSASTATSIFTGKKTHSGSINVDISKKIPYRTIAEQLRDQKGYKIGVVTTVNLNHATPAATYAHQASRKSNKPLADELVKSNFNYFAGGELMGTADELKAVYADAVAAGYTICKTQAEAEKLTAGAKAIVINEDSADSKVLPYENDRKSNAWSLRDYVKKGIEVIDNKKGFFMMVEGGKIDWACHANDARSTIADTIAFADAVKEAVAFYNEHPKETLIVVTADHETGGLTLGFAGTDYNLFFDNLENQKISFKAYDDQYVANYKKNQTPFADAMKDVENLFGLKAPGSEGDNINGGMVLTDWEYARLQEAYNRSINGTKVETQQEYELYGTYEPFSVTITHILNNKSGVNFASYQHTGLPVPVYALGVGQNNFSGYYDNTEIYNKLAAITKVVAD